MISSPRKPSPKPLAVTPDPIATSPITRAIDAIETAPVAETGISMATEVAGAMHATAGQSRELPRTAYDHVRAVAEATKGSFETSYSAAAKGLNEFNAKAIGALKSNADATFELLKALMNVKTMSEAITLQTEHARKQFEALTAQTKELAEIAKKVAAETTEPLKTSVAKTFGKAA